MNKITKENKVGCFISAIKYLGQNQIVKTLWP